MKINMELWIILSLLSAFLFGVKDIIAKKLLRSETHPSQILYEEFLLTLLVVLIIFFPKVEFESFFDYDLMFWFFIKAFSVGGSTLFYFILLKKYQISIVSPLLNLSPLILLILSYLFLQEIISIFQIIGIIIIILSTYFLEITVKHHEQTIPHNFHFKELMKVENSFFFQAFTMIFLISMSAISDKVILDVEKVNVYTNIFFTALIVFIVLTIYSIKEKNLLEKFKLILKEPETLIISVFSISSNFLILLAIAIPSALVSLIVPLRRTSTLFSSIFGGMIFHEKHLFKKIITIIFMTIGVILIAI